MKEKNTIKIAVQRLLTGNLVIFPTETVYGIGADATNSKAVKKIYKIKKRPLNNPIITHFLNLENLKEYVELNQDAIKLSTVFWPGPMTLILKKKKESLISPFVSNKHDLIGCRIPNNPIAQKVLKYFGRPIAAPSANISTKLSTTNVEQIDKKIKDNVFTINGGDCKLGLESTVINLALKNPRILRYGSITEEELLKILPNLNIKKHKNNKQVSPGMLNKHYSPNIPIRINVKKVRKDEVLLNFGSNNLSSDICELNLSNLGNLKEAAKNFFDYLHKLDKKKYKTIAVAPIPNIGLGKTINDRLLRASSIK